MDFNNTKNSQLDPLVSIIVITYNSAKYVLETLESAKTQNYQNIELIISDDCSTDDTVQICRKWINENKKRFVRTELITIEKNNGIPANCNRGIKAAHGKWVKFIAGDDALMANCIFDNVRIAIEHNYSVLQTNVNYYRNNFLDSSFIRASEIQNNNFYKNINSQKQLSMILYSNRVIAPSVFIKKEIIDEVGGFDESIKLFEDKPFWINLLKFGHSINVSDIITVNYRLHDNNSEKKGKKVMQKCYAIDSLNYSKKYKKNNVTFSHYLFYNTSLRMIIFCHNIRLFGINNLLDKLLAYFFRRVMQLGTPLEFQKK